MKYISERGVCDYNSHLYSLKSLFHLIAWLYSKYILYHAIIILFQQSSNKTALNRWQSTTIDNYTKETSKLINATDKRHILFTTEHFIIKDSEVIQYIRIVCIDKQRHSIFWMTSITSIARIRDWAAVSYITVVVNIDVRAKDWTVFGVATDSLIALSSLQESSGRNTMRVLQGEDECDRVILPYV